VVDNIRELLWPGGDPDHEWDVADLDTIGAYLKAIDYGPADLDPS
jgi:hypothetical protein